MKPRLHIRRFAGVVLTSVSLVLGSAAVAQANSIVYLKGGNVWLSTPDGSQGYQLTFDGGWDSPSEADSGTIMAVKGGETYRFSPSGQMLGAPVPTIFHGADRSTNVGPAGARLSPDGTKQSYWGTTYTSYDDYSCGCVMFRWEAFTRWGASDQFSEPNQTKGQELYGEPTWIDNGTLMVTDVGSVFGDQVATYTVGGGDNSLTQWFSDSDPAVKQLQYATITRQGDKLAFVASTQGTQDEIRFYQANGPAPSAPTPMCAITGANGGEFSSTSFAPDGTQIAWQEGDGIHEGSVGSLSTCRSITDRLVIPGGSQPFVGAADVNVANAPSPPASDGNAGGGAQGGGGQTGGGGQPGSSGGQTGGGGQPGSSGGQPGSGRSGGHHPGHRRRQHRRRHRHHRRPHHGARAAAVPVRAYR
jgi:hypothetical protein